MIYCKRLFLSTPSARRATVGSLMTAVVGEKFLSTPSARRATRCECHGTVWRTISIHALREESDATSPVCLSSPHLFLSTPSARRATHCGRRTCWLWWNFYPRPPRGERQFSISYENVWTKISIHALREESDAICCISGMHACEFLSTPSARRATLQTVPPEPFHQNFYPRPPRGERLEVECNGAINKGISIHALREESDGCCQGLSLHRVNFYPRPPRGERQLSRPEHPAHNRFLSTPSARRATMTNSASASRRRYFYPRPPRGERLPSWETRPIVSVFLSTPSARRATLRPLFRAVDVALISIHALREESDSRHPYSSILQ